jgi:type I protein arginine methyltransferase
LINTTVYTLGGYGGMLLDQGVMEPYRQALQQVIKPGAVVLDIGSGTGMFTFMACQCGAQRVYAIEAGYVIQVARDLAAANGFADRIEFIEALSTDVTLPEPVDVIVSDLHGVLPLFQQIIPSLVDARRRFLAPGGVFVPRRDTIWAAVVELEEVYQENIQPWGKDYHGLDLSLVRPLVTNDFRRVVIKAEQILAAPQCWASIDYTSVETPNVQGQITWSISRLGVGHGLGLWFDSDLAPGIGFSNAPGEQASFYGRMFFPWLEPVALAPGDTVTVDLYADLVGNQYVWRWDTLIQGPGRPDQPKASFRQSTFLSIPFSPAKVRQTSANYIPKIGQEGQIDRFILGLMEGDHSLGDIAQQVARQFPQRFANGREALTRAGELSLKYGRSTDSKYLREP